MEEASGSARRRNNCSVSRSFFTDENNGTTVGEGGTILRTTNGGNTWVPQSAEPRNTPFWSFVYPMQNNGTACGGTIGQSGNP